MGVTAVYVYASISLAALTTTLVALVVLATRHSRAKKLCGPPTEPPHPGVRTRQELQALASGEVVQLAESPQLFLLPGFCSSEECDHLIDRGRPRLARSKVGSGPGGQLSSDRTSYGAWLSRASTPTLARIEERISRVTQVPVHHGESMQVLRYEPGQFFGPHHDFAWDPAEAPIEAGGQRLVTVLIYLTTVEEGGETVFCGAPSQGKALPQASQCPGTSWTGLAVKPRKGDAVIFYNLHPDGQGDYASLHGSYPTVKGQKWAATKWLHAHPCPESVQPVLMNSHEKRAEESRAPGQALANAWRRVCRWQ